MLRLHFEFDFILNEQNTYVIKWIRADDMRWLATIMLVNFAFF